MVWFKDHVIEDVRRTPAEDEALATFPFRAGGTRGTHVPRPARLDGLKRGRFTPLMVRAPRPLIRPAPRSAMFFPLVVLLAVLPGMAALRTWDLTLPGPLWGLRAMAVVDGLVVDQTAAAEAIKPVREAAGFRSVALQPPLYAWLAAVGLTLSGDYDPFACVLPSYIAGVLVVILVYLHGRLWRGGGVGFTAALLVSFNPHLLQRVQEVTPSTLALAGCSPVCSATADGPRRSSNRSGRDRPRRSGRRRRGWPWV